MSQSPIQREIPLDKGRNAVENELQDYSNFIDGLLTQAEERVKGLPKQAFNWRPLERDTNSLAVIVTHMCGVADFWVYQGLSGEDVGRVRDNEFKAVVEREDELLALTARSKARVRTALEGCPSDSLGEIIKLPGRDPCTRRWAILHTMDELAQHLGHLELTRQLWEAGQSCGSDLALFKSPYSL